MLSSSWWIVFRIKIVFKKERKDFKNNLAKKWGSHGPRGPSRSFAYEFRSIWPSATFWRWAESVIDAESKYKDDANFSYVRLLTLAPAGVWANLEPAGGFFQPPPVRSRELRNASWSGKRRYLGRAKFYKKHTDNFFMGSKLRPQEVNRCQIFPKSGYFLRNSRLSRSLCKLTRFRNSQMIALDLNYQPVPSDWRSDQ